MDYKIFILIFGVLLCQVQAQVCVGPSPQLISTGPYVAQPVVATTIVDNSVSNALANALQLLIVSELIDSKLCKLCPPNALLSAPLLERCSPIIDVLGPCATPIEIKPPCVPIFETIAPCYGGITETFCSNPFCNCGCDVYSTFGPNIATIPNIYGGVTELISPPCVPQFPCCGGYTELIAPGCCPNYYTEVFTPNPFLPNPCGCIPECLAPLPCYNPCCGGLTEFINPYAPNFYGGVTEIVSPLCPCTPGCIGSCMNEFIAPSFIPNCYGGLTEVISPYNPGCPCGVPEVIAPNFFGINEFIAPGPYGPLAAEVLFPPCIPTQLPCNFGYVPTTVPCVSFNVEPQFEPCGCGCNGFPKGFYY